MNSRDKSGSLDVRYKKKESNGSTIRVRIRFEHAISKAFSTARSIYLPKSIELGCEHTARGSDEISMSINFHVCLSWFAPKLDQALSRVKLMRSRYCR